jgi:hypothetical protein
MNGLRTAAVLVCVRQREKADGLAGDGDLGTIERDA